MEEGEEGVGSEGKGDADAGGFSDGGEVSDVAGDAVGERGEEDFGEIGELEGVGFEGATLVSFAGEFAETVSGADDSVEDAVSADAGFEFGGDFVGEGQGGDRSGWVRVIDLGERGDEGEGFAGTCAGGDESVLAGGGEVEGDERLLRGECCDEGWEA